MNELVFYAFLATLGTWFVTSLGAAMVVFFKKPNRSLLNLMLGFASGVMIAASFWSLLEPAIEQAGEVSEIPAYIIVFFGFLFGVLFMYLCDKTVSVFKKSKDLSSNRIMMIILSITLHNIPEGLAVGVAFGALSGGNITKDALMGAITIAIGIGIQNFPEGAAVSLPLRREGKSRLSSFLLGQASGLVEPIAGIIGAMLVVYVKALLPYALSFAAGAMILVAVHELIPECQQEQKHKPYFATSGIVMGFALMMLLDVMLG